MPRRGGGSIGIALKVYLRGVRAPTNMRKRLLRASQWFLRPLRLPAVFGAALLALSLAACQGCHPLGTSGTPAGEPGKPSLRLYLVSDLAGALEPCGCTKDQLGGLDHFGAWVKSERSHAPQAIVASAGAVV